MRPAEEFTASPRTDPSIFSRLLQDELTEYMNYNMGLEELQGLLPENFPILSVNGPWLEFTEIPESGRTIDAFAADLASSGRELEPGLVRTLKSQLPSPRLYRHQERAIGSIMSGSSVVLPHPTGSGKTEAFVVPILQYLLREIREGKRYGLGCVMIYPMKALENDQRDRLKDFLFDLEQELGERIPYIGVYDGDTPTKADFERLRRNQRRIELRRYREVCPSCSQETLRYNPSGDSHLLRCELREDEEGNLHGCGYPEEATAGIPWIRVTREDMRNDNYPNLLITNPESLDFRLLSSEDNGVFRTQMEKVIIVIDEAHAYSASSALSLRFLLSRFEEEVRRINGREVKFQYVISSATLDEPQRFAQGLVPWVDFEVIPFTAKPASFDSRSPDLWQLSRSLIGVDVDNLEWLFDAFGEAPYPEIESRALQGNDAESLIEALTQFGLVRVDGEALAPGSDLVGKARMEYELDNKNEAKRLLYRALRAKFRDLDQASRLYHYVSEKPRTLESLVEWWKENWPSWTQGDISENIASLVRMGRRLGLWEERWHLFVKSPLGVAGCAGDRFHAYPLSSEEPFPELCQKCDAPGPVYEIWTCSDCSEIYYILYRCRICEALGPSQDRVCEHDQTHPMAVRRRDAIGIHDLPELRHVLFDPEKEACQRCSGKLLPVRRRTDLLIDMAISLVGWHTDETRRKFLLFTDGRAGSERIGREFNNLEEVIWAERLLMDVLLRDPTHDIHDSRLIPEVRRKLFSRLYTPYRSALNRILRGYEKDLLDRDLAYAAFKALGKSTKGPSRLFKHGLLAYAFDDFQERVGALELETVLPRVVDIVRLRTSSRRGIRTENIVKHFLQGHPDTEPYFKELAGMNHERIFRSIDLLEDAGWIRKITKPNGTWIFFNEGEAADSEDPFVVARDVRKVRIPRRVFRCDTCGDIKWYQIEICERCGNPVEELTHEELLAADYFARVLIRTPRPIVSAIHRAGLGGLERRLIEERFGSTKNAIHFLCATPTLELGIDIGLLQFVLLAGVPPTKTNYIQRVGRAGRRRNEGAMCITFTYPGPVDTYYFRQPESLVAMKTGRMPVQRLAPEHLEPFLWSVAMDAFLMHPSRKSRKTFVGGISAREFLEGQAALKLADLSSELLSVWESTVRPWIESVARRCVLQDKDQVTEADIMDAVDAMLSSISDESLLAEKLFKLDAFSALKSQLDSIHLDVTRRIAGHRANRRRNKEAQQELERLEREDGNLQEFRRRHMMGDPLLMYLHGVGTLSSPRGIGGSVVFYDVEDRVRKIDDRQSDIVISDRFPGAYFSRQGAIYRVNRVVYDPINRPRIRVCPECEQWLDDELTVCPEHPAADIEALVLEAPVVGFGGITRVRSRETRGNRIQRLRSHGVPATRSSQKVGSATVAVSEVWDVSVATYCSTYDVFDHGRRSSEPRPIQECSNCRSYTTGECCDSPDPRNVVQGVVYKSSGVRFELNRDYLESVIRGLPSNLVVESHEPAERYVTQSLSNSILNSFSIVLGVEPSMLDATLDSDTSFWIFEPVAGGYGLLEDILQDPHELDQVFERVIQLIKTRPEEHECPRYCDQCLIIPRYSREELRLLHRPLLEYVMGIADA